jgi:MFS family permease
MTADVTQREMLGAVIGVYRMAGDLGLLLGPVALGALATRFGFETAFGVAGLFALATLAVGFSVAETLGARSAADRDALATVAD